LVQPDLKQTTQNKTNYPGSPFADDIALLDVSLNGIQDLTSQVKDAAKLVGLRVNAKKQR